MQSFHKDQETALNDVQESLAKSAKEGLWASALWRIDSVTGGMTTDFTTFKFPRREYLAAIHQLLALMLEDNQAGNLMPNAPLPRAEAEQTEPVLNATDDFDPSVLRMPKHLHDPLGYDPIQSVAASQIVPEPVPLPEILETTPTPEQATEAFSETLPPPLPHAPILDNPC